MKTIRLLISTKITLVLLIAFAVAMAAATFIENDHGTAVARGQVYEAWWFEVLMVWLSVNFLAHIEQYKLFSAKRWPIGLFHVAFVIIILGAGVTRYFSHEGIMHIRQGQEVNTFYTSDNYLQLRSTSDEDQVTLWEKPLLVLPKNFKPKSFDFSIEEQRLRVEVSDYIPTAREVFVPGDETFIDLAVAFSGAREDYLLQPGQWVQLGNISLDSQKDSSHPVRIYQENGQWLIYSEIPMQMMSMVNQEMGRLPAHEPVKLKEMNLYQWDEGAMMIKGIYEQSKLSYVQETNEEVAKNLPDVVQLNIKNEKQEIIHEAYSKLVSLKPGWSKFKYDGKSYALTYGPKSRQIPFSLYLNAFELERYPGSQSPSSYASEVMVMDGENEFPYRIFMNNVLDYKGYRFYQSSYDSDERGTILSINQDRPGTYITYLGYILLTLGMFLTLFTKGSRFQTLNRKLKNLKNRESDKTAYKQGKLVYIPVVLMLLMVSWGMMGNKPTEFHHPEIVPQSHAEAYGKLLVQDLDGRMKPLNTLAHEIVRKLTGKSYMVWPEDNSIRLSPEQFLLAIQMDPVGMSEQPLLKIDQEKSLEVFEKLGLSPRPALSFKDFLDEEGNYKIRELVEEANLLKPAARHEGHKELLKTDERFNIFYGMLTGDFLRLFPNRNDPNHTWYSSYQYMQGFEEEDAIFVKNITPMYLQAIRTGLEEGDWSEAEEILSYIDLYQKKAGDEVYPDTKTIEAELLYNRLNLGTRLFGPFWLMGILLLTLAILMLFYRKRWMENAWTAGKLLSWIGLATFTFHLGLRWYIAKHPPWSDGFEMMVFVAWGVLFFGLLFAKKSRFTLPLGLLFSGTLLFVGFLDWLNPEITNLMPVLHSYWLKIHVAIIVSGYAPLALAAVIGLLSLVLMVFRPKNSMNRWYDSLKELQMVNEMSITIGLFLLTVGTFLGGVWANESWGRYWAWDPKETWALISIIVYAFVLHLRLIPDYRGSLLYNLASLWAFAAIIMTSFGVNYYLSGLHSYAKGDPVPVPQWVYWVVAILLGISLFAIRSYQKLPKAEQEKIKV